MNFDLPEGEEDQQSDGRLTIVLLLVFLLLFWSLSYHGFFTRNTISHNNMVLDVTHERLLYLKEDDKITQHPESLPISYYPLFFRPLPINSADKELLMTIKGIGPTLAESIVTHRHKVGPILNIGDLQGIPGIGGKRATSLATEMVFDKAN